MIFLGFSLTNMSNPNRLRWIKSTSIRGQTRQNEPSDMKFKEGWYFELLPGTYTRSQCTKDLWLGHFVRVDLKIFRRQATELLFEIISKIFHFGKTGLNGRL